jgi:large subunit ribosomal protein L18
MSRIIERKIQRKARARRVRAKVFGTAERPRLSVFRSLRNFSAQAINDDTSTTLVSVDLRELGKKATNTVDGIRALGVSLGEKCLAAGIKTVTFDRAGYRYHGKVKAFADGAREAGLEF